MRPRSSDALIAVVLLSAIAATIVPLAKYHAVRGAMAELAREHAASREPVAVIAAGGHDFLFFDSYVYPRTARLYRSIAAYRADAHAPRDFVYFTDRKPSGARRFTTARSFLVPLVTASGPYTTEAWLRGRAHVRVELVPEHVVKTLTIDGERVFADFVRQNFAREETGWLRVTSDAPVEVSFALVNGDKAAPLRIVTETHGTWRVAGGDKLWTVTENGVTSATAAQCPCDVHALYAFGSRKLPDGNTEFVWP